MTKLIMLLSFLLSLALVQSSSPSYCSCNHENNIHNNIENKIFNVLNYGAIGDGYSDDTKAFKDAWEETCNYIGSEASLIIPHGRTFLLQPIGFHGPCKSNKIDFQVRGGLIAPEAPYQWKCDQDSCHTWIQFSHIDGLYIDGHGTIDGQGPNWWSIDCKKYMSECRKRPRGVVISHSSNVYISNILVKDSPNFQLSLEDLKSVFVQKITITADGHSPNTDGIHIQRSQNVHVYNSVIRTGDDCISIGDGSRFINISQISCGPGHGISIGSLGRDGSKETVENVVVRDSTFRETDNGVRIKTWQGGRGHVRNVLFERIQLHKATRPIIIDQFYCPHRKCRNYTEAVEIKNVRYNHIYGTSIKKPFVQLLCSESVPCEDIFMNNINIRDEDEDKEKIKHKSSHHDHPSTECINVRGESKGMMIPKLSCLESNRN